MKAILEVKDLWKEYRRGVQKEKYLSLRENITRGIKPKRKNETFWALEDVNFQVYPGDSLAIIGKNGAGKSTLLKILSKITPPTKGEITLRGRLASLLEVGTGFHPELTGRENIYLNGSILGLNRKEINSQFDAIVDFSGVGAFLDTPLKHYSSGMQLRLAFAVAAHLEPEILVIDEVLAVGDSAFQQKCIDKMTEVSQSGRTILFVSHNFQAVRNLCEKAILLDHGKMIGNGSVEEIISQYRQNFRSAESEESLLDIPNRRGSRGLIMANLLSNAKDIEWGEKLKMTLMLKTETPADYRDLEFGIALQDEYNKSIIHLSNKYLKKNIERHLNDNMMYTFEMENSLSQGRYSLVLFLRANDIIQDWLSDFLYIEIPEGNQYAYHNSSEIKGLVQPGFQMYVKEKVG